MNNKQLRLSTAAVLATSVALTAMPTSSVQAATNADSATINTKATPKVPTYKDVPLTANYYEAVEELTKQGLITGYANKTFKPNAKITRGQIAKILSRMLDLKTTKKTKFTDVPSSHDFYEVANAVVVAGLMSPDSKGKFNTKSFLTREEYADILTKAFELQTKTNSLPFKDFNANYKNSIQAVYDHGIMRGNTAKTFNGKGHVSRSQVALTLYRTIEMQNDPTPPAENPGETEVETKTFSIYELDDTKVLTYDDEEFTIPENMRKLISKYNADVLVDAEITATFVKGKWMDTHSISLFPYKSPPAYSTLEGFGGTYPITILSNGLNVRLHNMTVNDVRAGDSADYQLTLEKVNVKNKVIVQEGSSYNFQLQLMDSVVPYVAVNQDSIHIDSNKTIPQLFLEGGVYDISVNSHVNRMQIVREGAVTLAGAGTIDNIIVPMDAEIYVNSHGTIKNLRIDNPDAWIQIGEKASIKKVTIPRGALYEEILSYDGHIQDRVEKIVYPNSNANILSQLIEKPSKEEIAYQNAVKNVIKGFSSSLSGKRMTIMTEFNDIPKTLHELTFNQIISIAGAVPSVEYIPLVIRRGGIEVYNDEISVQELVEGVSLEDLTGEAFTFADVRPNDRLLHHFDFDTTQELKLRSKIIVNEEDRLTTEQTINAGANAKYTAEIQKAFNAYAVSASGKTITSSIRLNAVNSLINEAPVDQYIKLLDAPTETMLTMTVKKNGEQLYKGAVPVATLRNGVNLSAISSSMQETIGTLKASGETRYTIEFETERELNFEHKLLMHKAQRGTTQVSKINSGATQNYATEVMKAFKAYTVTSAGKTMSANIELNAVNDLVKTAPVEQNIKLLSSTTSQSLEMIIKKDGTQLYKGNVPVATLRNGLNISTLNASLKQTLSTLKANGTSTFTYEFTTNEVLQFEHKLLIDNVQRGTTQRGTTDGGAAQQLEAIAPKYKHKVTSEDASFIFEFDRLAAANVPAFIEATPVDVNLKLSDAKLLPKTVELRISYGAEQKVITVQHSDLLGNGVNVMAAANFTKKLTLKDLVAGASFTVTVLTPLDGKLTTSALVNGVVKGSATSPGANVTTVQKLATSETATNRGTATTTSDSGVANLDLFAGKNQLVVETTYKAFTSADNGRFLDARLTLDDKLPNASSYTISIAYNGAPVPGVGLKTISTEDLKKGVYLSSLLGTKPQLASNQRATTDKWSFVVHDLKGVEMPVKVEVVTLSTNDTAAVTAGGVYVLAGAQVVVNKAAQQATAYYSANSVYASAGRLPNVGSTAQPMERILLAVYSKEITKQSIDF